MPIFVYYNTRSPVYEITRPRHPPAALPWHCLSMLQCAWPNPLPLCHSLTISSPVLSLSSLLSQVLPSLGISPLLHHLRSNVAPLPVMALEGSVKPLTCCAVLLPLVGGRWGALSTVGGKGLVVVGCYGLSHLPSPVWDGSTASGHLPAFACLQSNAPPCTSRKPPAIVR